MKNFLNQEIGQGSVVYIGEKQGSHGRMLGIVCIDHGGGDVTVEWCFELFSEWTPISKKKVHRGPTLVVLDASVLASVYHPEGA